MTTPITRAAVSMVSLAALLAATLPFGACAGRTAPVTQDATFAAPDGRLTIKFDNQAERYVDVYLITPQRQWQLGRVGPGAQRILSIPEAALASTVGFVRLAVLAGEPMTLDAANDPHAAFTILQPATALFSQRWTFLETSLATPEVRGAPANRQRP